MRDAICIIVVSALVGCASSSPNVSGSYRQLEVGGRRFSYRSISCAPTLVDTDAVLIIQGVEIKEPGVPSTKDYLASLGVDRTGGKVPLLPAISYADLPADEAIAFKLRVVAINAVCAATCQTIARLGDRPDLVLKYSLERDRLLHDLLLLAFATQARKEVPEPGVSHFYLRGDLTDEEIIAIRAAAIKNIAERIVGLENLNATLQPESPAKPE